MKIITSDRQCVAVANIPRLRIALIVGVLLGIGVGAVAIGLDQWASMGYSYRTHGDARLASISLDLVSIGFFSLIMGLLAIRFPLGFLNSRSPNAKLVGALIGGGGTIALLSLQNLFYFLLSQDYFSLELIAAEISIGLFLLLLAAVVYRRR
jgi:hypothetical protein